MGHSPALAGTSLQGSLKREAPSPRQKNKGKSEGNRGITMASIGALGFTTDAALCAGQRLSEVGGALLAGGKRPIPNEIKQVVSRNGLDGVDVVEAFSASLREGAEGAGWGRSTSTLLARLDDLDTTLRVYRRQGDAHWGSAVRSRMEAANREVSALFAQSDRRPTEGYKTRIAASYLQAVADAKTAGK